MAKRHETKRQLPAKSQSKTPRAHALPHRPVGGVGAVTGSALGHVTLSLRHHFEMTTGFRNGIIARSLAPTTSIC
jgi:hypothetical protein